MKEAAIDTLRTLGVGSGGLFVTWLEWLPITVRIMVGVATAFYLVYKGLNEKLLYEEKSSKKSSSNSR
jgi:hypothetical protein